MGPTKSAEQNGELVVHPQSGLKLDISAPAEIVASPPVADSELCAIKAVGRRSRAIKPIFLTMFLSPVEGLPSAAIFSTHSLLTHFKLQTMRPGDPIFRTARPSYPSVQVTVVPAFVAAPVRLPLAVPGPRPPMAALA
ncbi:MAG: hypothetical protein WAM68_12165, partial [Acidobacteriaceae bacterium]